MEQLRENVNRFLPYGDTLRSVLHHPSISKSDVRALLRGKGIYTTDVEDETTFPLLITSLLSPSEYEFIKERLQSREDREKTFTRTFQWSSDQSLISAVPSNFNVQEIVKTTFPRYKIVGNPNFRMLDNNPNRIALDFKCETENYSKEWYRTKNEFKGQITLEKGIDKDGDVQLQIIHTSPETTQASDKIVKALERHFKDNNYVDPANEIKRILYRDFSNRERIAFFLSFMSDFRIFSFQRASHLDIGPDPSTSLPENINWMELAQVKELQINGEGLHKINLISDKTLHQYLELAQVKITYSFRYHAAEGQCKINFGFSGYMPNRIANTEFVVDIEMISLKDEYAHLHLPSVRNYLLKEFDKFRTEKYRAIQEQSSIVPK